MDSVVNALSLGMIGYVPGNGHPFSFSAIVNGYDDAAMREAGWQVIADYLARQNAHDIGIPDVTVSCCWAEEEVIAHQIARACHVETVIPPAEMIERGIDAAIIARDDWRSHAQLAMPFLQAGIPVFVDKPLTLDRNELRQFRPFLESGMLMSCSALRYARELDALRAGQTDVGQLQLVTGVGPLSMDRYGIHLIEAAVGAVPMTMRALFAHRASDREHAVLKTDDDILVTINTLGRTAKRFRLSFYGDQGAFEVDIGDNFSAFRRCLLAFLEQVRTGMPAIPPSECCEIIELMIDIEGLAAA